MVKQIILRPERPPEPADSLVTFYDRPADSLVTFYDRYQGWMVFAPWGSGREVWLFRHIPGHCWMSVRRASDADLEVLAKLRLLQAAGQEVE